MERGVLSVEDAARSATSQPVHLMGLDDRGMIRAGMAADIVVFDPQNLRDTATFFEPHQHAEGIEWVFVNGTAVVRDGELSQAMPGRIPTSDRRNAATDGL